VRAGLLRDLVEVKGRFHRSVWLNRDWEEGSDFGDYLLTPTARELATRMTAALEEPGGTRAWSVTGPYGSGKSAFALFLTNLLAHDPPQNPHGEGLRWDLGLRPTVRSHPSRWAAGSADAQGPKPSLSRKRWKIAGAHPAHPCHRRGAASAPGTVGGPRRRGDSGAPPRAVGARKGCRWRRAMRFEGSGGHVSKVKGELRGPARRP
jgi:hypothetical protein